MCANKIRIISISMERVYRKIRSVNLIGRHLDHKQIILSAITFEIYFLRLRTDPMCEIEILGLSRKESIFLKAFFECLCSR